ncbi:MAG: FixH family protein [Cyclobacteriaceae bacterium]
MNWGGRIVLAFVAFIVIITSMVVISMRQDFFLVAEDYYDQEIQYQTQIDKMKTTNSANASVKLSKEANKLNFMFSENPEKGEIHFFRPSDATKDFRVAVLNEKNQSIDKSKLTKGLWRVKISWSASGKEFYTEETVII